MTNLFEDKILPITVCLILSLTVIYGTWQIIKELTPRVEYRLKCINGYQYTYVIEDESIHQIIDENGKGKPCGD